MRLIHTADWHFGQTLRGHDRREEHVYFIDQLINYIEQYKPDALLVSGDLYDNSTATAETDNFFRTQILRIRQAAPAMRIIMIAGNHDGYAKQEADSRLWQLGNINVIGHIAIQNSSVDYDSHIIELSDKGYVLPIPFTRYYPPMPENDELKMRKPYFYETLLAQVAEKNKTGLPVIMMGHLNYEGAEIAEQESLIRGGEEATKETELGTGYDYLAMGHIHYPQTHGRARYAGSPIPINFSEGYQHSVTLVEIEKHGDMPNIVELPLRPLYQMKKLTQQQNQSLDDFLQYAQQHIGNQKCYIRFALYHNNDMITCEKKINNMVEQMTEWIYCGYETIILPTSENRQSTVTYTPQQLETIDPILLAKNYYREVKGDELDPQLEELLKLAINQIEE